MRPLPYGSGKQGTSSSSAGQITRFNEAAPLRKRKGDATGRQPQRLPASMRPLPYGSGKGAVQLAVAIDNVLLQ